jgi:hypothetical protein
MCTARSVVVVKVSFRVCISLFSSQRHGYYLGDHSFLRGCGKSRYLISL